MKILSIYVILKEMRTAASALFLQFLFFGAEAEIKGITDRAEAAV
ncbi:MAG: hypothetical protein ACOX8M_00095 [Marvinbryantia sp.]